ncbi:MAG TPA: hypothetical protein DHW82_09135 [Spirochaetia bacterium]|nr:MAG: hypothetical protein A2Y41_04230 [Spirochaetes bacterium GWB1_36_13]HCL57153.1 hypothetical protein [Spirochaetia bacterium]
MTKERRRKGFQSFITLFFGILIVGFYLFRYQSALSEKKENYLQSLVFQKEGELLLKDENKTPVIKIDIEFAETEDKRIQGLMFRKSMPEKAGMLFLFDEEGEKSFWMKNTQIPLDILFIDKEKKIMHIVENTVPYSLIPIRSEGKAFLVLEVNSGFVKTYKIKKGMKVEYTRT